VALPPFLHTGDFPREFALFVNLVGAERLQKPIKKVAAKLDRLDPVLRGIYLDRYDIALQLLAFDQPPYPFQLDVRDPRAVRTASFVAGINRMAERLDTAGRHELAKRVTADLAADRDIRGLELEVTVFNHLHRKGFDFRLADFEGSGTFDFLAVIDGREVEIECKTVTGTTGFDIKEESQVTIGKTFINRCREGLNVPTSGIFILSLKEPIKKIENLSQAMTDMLRRCAGEPVETNIFRIEWKPRPMWQTALVEGDRSRFEIDFAQDEAIGRDFCVQTTKHRRPLALVVRPYKPPTLAQKLSEIIKDAGGQCSKTRPAIIWVGLSGHDEDEFHQLAEFSLNSHGGGLNAIFANSFHPGVDRDHIAGARFSVRARSVSSTRTLGPDQLMAGAYHIGGALYHIPNPHCSFGVVGEL